MAARKLDWTDGVTIAALLLILFVALIYVPFGWPVFGRIFRSQAVTAWVQAIGTIGAVLAAIGLAWSQRKAEIAKQNHRRHEADRALAMVVMRAIDEAELTLKYIFDRLKANYQAKRTLRTERVEDLQMTFGTLLDKDLPDELVYPVLMVKRQLAYALMAMRELQTTKLVTVKRVVGARTRYNRVHKEAMLVHEVLRRNRWITEVQDATRRRVRTLDSMPPSFVGEPSVSHYLNSPEFEAEYMQHPDIPPEVEMTEDD